MAYTQAELDNFAHLYSLSVIPLRVVLGSLTFGLCDYVETFEDEVRYIWPQRRSFGKAAYLFVRYYTILVLIFDVLQIHTFAIPGVTSNTVCVAMDPTTRMAGAISLWAIEIIMQVRVYALFDCSKRVALFNAVMFICSIASFLVLLVVNAKRRASLIASAIRLPLPGCPAINGGTGWALWLPASGYEFILFVFVVYKSLYSLALKVRLGDRRTLGSILMTDNMYYFLGITLLLAFNNAMAAGATKVIPWFGYGPFHAAMGIMTTRMLMHLRKSTQRTEFLTHADGIESDPDVNGDVLLVAFSPSESAETRDSGYVAAKSTVRSHSSQTRSDLYVNEGGRPQDHSVRAM